MIKISKRGLAWLGNSWFIETKIGFIILSTVAFLIIAAAVGYGIYAVCPTSYHYREDCAWSVALGILVWLPMNWLMIATSSLDWFTRPMYYKVEERGKKVSIVK